MMSPLFTILILDILIVLLKLFKIVCNTKIVHKIVSYSRYVLEKRQVVTMFLFSFKPIHKYYRFTTVDIIQHLY